MTIHLRYFRRQPFTAVDEEGRTAERYRLAALGAAWTAISRLTGLALIVLSVRWAAPVLGTERFGIWATFSSLTVMLSFLDLGVGNALVNRVAHATAKLNPRQISLVVMGGILWLMAIGLGGTALLAAAGAWIPWTGFFRLSGLASGSETRTAALVYSGLFGMNIVSSGLLKILVGQQRSHEAQMITAIAALLACPAVWFTLRHAPDIGGLLMASIGTQSVVTITLVMLLLHRRRTLDFRVALSGMAHEREALLSSSAMFLFLQVGTMIGWGGDNFLLAGIVGVVDVAPFAVAQRLFLVASQPVSILNGSLWAAYADAQAKQDHVFIRKTLLHSFFISMIIVIVISVVLLLAGTWIVSSWTENSIKISWLLLAVFAIWTPLESAGAVLSIYLNGIGVVREQAIVVTAFCIVALPAKIIAASRFGAVGLVAATTAAYAITVVGLYGTVFRERILAPIRTTDSARRTSAG